MRSLFALILGLCPLFASEVHADPPFDETYLVSAEIIRGTDGTTFIGSRYLGNVVQNMRDNRRGRRAPDLWKDENVHEFQASFAEGIDIPVYVSLDFGDQTRAELTAQPYLLIFGQLPTILKVGVDAIMIQPGDAFWAGGQRRTIVFHHGKFDRLYQSGHVEELIFHEATHASLEPGNWDSVEWTDAQRLDQAFISTYGERYPAREDFAESYLMYYASRIKSDRISSNLRAQIERTIPARIEYFEELVPLEFAEFYALR